MCQRYLGRVNPEKKAFQDLVEPMYAELPADKMQQVTEIRNSMQ
ncbi:hypothetical protein [Buttiauxella sp. 3AFRM03]|nr:hypothetical protein [Buttiauxella sp. 3AFRM03]